MGADSRTTTGGGGRARNLLVAGEVATAVLLLFGAGLLLRTLIAVDSFDRGFKAHGVLTMLVDPMGSSYPTPEKLQAFYDQIEADVRAIPDVKDMAWSSDVPLGESVFGEYPNVYAIAGDPPVDEAHQPTTSFQIASPSYFSTLDLAIVEGRGFDGRDSLQAPRVCIVNEAFARTLGGRNPVGLQVTYKPADSPNAKPATTEIIGVARQVKRRPDEAKEYVQLYVPLAQNLTDDMMLLVRSKSSGASSLAPAVRAAIAKSDRDQTVGVASVTTLEDVEWAATGRQRFRAVMVSAFAALAVLLAMVGVFGILAYSVQQRMRDFGVRRALGASTRDVVRLVVGDAVKVIAIGGVAGLILSALLGRLLVSMLFGVQPLDVTTFAMVTAVLAITAAASIAGPAWRAVRIDPATVLRSK
jgi:putative ABC transport system permease protein